MDETVSVTPAASTESQTAAAPSASEAAPTPPAASEVPSAAPSAPVTPTPPAASAPTTEPAPAVTPETSAPSTPPQTTAAEATKADGAKEPASLLSDAATPAPEPTAEAKPEGEKPTAEQKPEGEAPVEEARPEEAPLPEYDVFTVPEGVELDDGQVDKYVGILGAAEREIAKDPAKIHDVMQRIGQEFLDLYTNEVESLGERIAETNAETFRSAQDYFKQQFFEDPEIGGNRKDTTLRNCGSVINRFGGTPQQQAELRGVLSMTGAGNNVAVIRLLNNFASFLGEGQPVTAPQPEPQPQARKEKRYGNRK